MAITRTVREMSVGIDAGSGAISSVTLQCRCVFDDDPQNPGMSPPDKTEQYYWNYADLTDDEQAAVVTLLNTMTARMDTDHPINSG